MRPVTLPAEPQTFFRARLEKRLQRSDRFLAGAIQAAALVGCLLGVMIYAWLAVRADTQSVREGLTGAAAIGAVAAEADLARIDAAAINVAPLISEALLAGASPDALRSAGSEVTGLLSGTPVTAVIVFDETGDVTRIFGQVPSDAAQTIGPRPSSRRAGAELLELELVSVSKRRAAYYRDLPVGGGKSVPVALILRVDAFQAALQVGSGAGENWRAALLNRDGEPVLSAAAGRNTFSGIDAAFAASALGWGPLHGDESSAADQATGKAGNTFIETRGVANEALHLIYIGEARPVWAVLASRRFEFAAVIGISLLALMLAISVVQNEWQRSDKQARDADLIAAQAKVTCDLLAAGVIEWSVADGVVDYSEGWAELFAQGNRPVSEEIFDWIGRIHPDDRLAARQSYQAMLDGRESELVHRIRIRMSSGLWVQVVERGRAIAGVNGATKRIVLVQTTEPVDGSALRNVFGEAARTNAKAVQVT